MEPENEIMSHPEVAEAAVIAHLQPRGAKWWLPDAVEFGGYRVAGPSPQG